MTNLPTRLSEHLSLGRLPLCALKSQELLVLGAGIQSAVEQLFSQPDTACSFGVCGREGSKRGSLAELLAPGADEWWAGPIEFKRLADDQAHRCRILRTTSFSSRSKRSRWRFSFGTTMTSTRFFCGSNRPVVPSITLTESSASIVSVRDVHHARAVEGLYLPSRSCLRPRTALPFGRPHRAAS